MILNKSLIKEEINQIDIFYSKEIGPIINNRIKHDQILNEFQN